MKENIVNLLLDQIKGLYWNIGSDDCKAFLAEKMKSFQRIITLYRTIYNIQRKNYY